MRLHCLAPLVGAALVVLATPAEAWKTYISHPLGFSFQMPGEVKMEKRTYHGAAGTHDAIVFRSVDDNIEYKATVVDLAAQADDAANLLGEAEFTFQQGKKVLMDAFVRADRVYGRKLAIDLPNNGGRSTASFYFVDGRLISVQATVLPANGDYGSPNMGKFVDSIAFYTIRVPPDATELPPTK